MLRAARQASADAALGFSKGRGVVVADINSRVDYGHPALMGHLTGGYDFVMERGQGGASLNLSVLPSSVSNSLINTGTSSFTRLA